MHFDVVKYILCRSWRNGLKSVKSLQLLNSFILRYAHWYADNICENKDSLIIRKMFCNHESVLASALF